MALVEKIFTGKVKPTLSVAEFWLWFQKNEVDFYKAIKENKNIEKLFYKKFSNTLDTVKEGYYFLLGMRSESVAELVITADGNIAQIAFVEELVKAAPLMPNWKFTALKPAIDTSNFEVTMGGYHFNEHNLRFYPTVNPHYPDEIEINVVLIAFRGQVSEDLDTGLCLFLDNLLGELFFAESIDNLKVHTRVDKKQELIPITKLKQYIVWRQEEFVEKYKGVHYNTDEEEFTMYESHLRNGGYMVAGINRDLLFWEGVVSYPWILMIDIHFKGQEDNMGMPDEKTNDQLSDIDDEFLLALKPADESLYIGRYTLANLRQVFFACKDFRQPSLEAYKIKRQNEDRYKIEYKIFKDKYWQCFDKFREAKSGKE